MTQNLIYRKPILILMSKIRLIMFFLLLLARPAASVDSDKWDLVAHQEIVPQQSFHVEDYTVTLADREKNGLDDYTVIVYIEHNGTRQTELMRDGDTAFFDVDKLQLEYVGTKDDKQIFDVYQERDNLYTGVVGVPENVSEPVTRGSVNMSAQPEFPTISFDDSNLVEIGVFVLLVGFRKH